LESSPRDLSTSNLEVLPERRTWSAYRKAAILKTMSVDKSRVDSMKLNRGRQYCRQSEASSSSLYSAPSSPGSQESQRQHDVGSKTAEMHWTSIYEWKKRCRLRYLVARIARPTESGHGVGVKSIAEQWAGC
jgi:hypothetical protein